MLNHSALNRFYVFIKHQVFILSVITCTLSIVCTDACAQKYNFTHYDIDHGLIQSQATMLSQDTAHRLWIGTLGGACRFDGKSYFTISKANGLTSNLVYAVFTDKQGTVWLGTHKGLARYKGNKIYNYPIPLHLKYNWITRIVQDGSGVIWIIMDDRLFRVNGNTLQQASITGAPQESITSITPNKAGELYAAVYKKGIYTLKAGKWRRFVLFTPGYVNFHIRKMAFDRKNESIIYLLQPNGLYVIKNGSVAPYLTGIPGFENMCMSFGQDADNNIWIGTGMGAYYFKNSTNLHFTAASGFTDNPITDIYCDTDNNMWLAASGSGIFKYEGDDHVTYGQSEGLKFNQVVMGITRDKNNKIILGTDAGLLTEYNGIYKPLTAQGQEPEMVQNLFTDSKGNVWVGGHGAAKYDGNKFEVVKLPEKASVLAFTEDKHGVIWMASTIGCMYYEKEVLHTVPGKQVFASSLLLVGKDSILAGTQDGLMLIVNKKWVPGFKLSLPANTSVFCLLKIKHGILIGTDDRGILAWDRKSNKITNYTIQHGLKSNVVYSLAVDNKGIVWAGTGRGVNRIAVDAETLQCTVLGHYFANDPVVEANQNAALYYNNKIYIGTAKGLTVYNTLIDAPSLTSPHIIIQGIKLVKKGKTISLAQISSKNLKLSANENHLSISFLGVYLKNPGGVTYQYKLTGLEDKFSQHVLTNTVDYPALPPGKYTFEVRATSPDGVISKTTAKFSFEIIPPFYQTIIFRLIMLGLMVLLVIALQNWWHQTKKKRELVIEAIKQEEKIKIRQQTAEDFHDDLGNKLTRITLLSEMLHIKIDKDKSDQQTLVNEIKQNAAFLYNGTRDILWALDPKSDNLYETLKHIEEIGCEMFSDTGITFTNLAISEDCKLVKLSMEYNRNITMIFKELMNNALKHADAKKVTLSATCSDKNEMTISLADDGKGFLCGRESKGHGLKNAKTRAARINGSLEVISEDATGTAVSLMFYITRSAT
ncbi:MAG: hypothetical protein EOP47_18055 [Sphingobacteriaceae bacterium]|nr:MAG: hypothetical protein EOP47_18055 [Sphingobacteriaceae bacterium]